MGEQHAHGNMVQKLCEFKVPGQVVQSDNIRIKTEGKGQCSHEFIIVLNGFYF